MTSIRHDAAKCRTMLRRSDGRGRQGSVPLASLPRNKERFLKARGNEAKGRGGTTNALADTLSGWGETTYRNTHKPGRLDRAGRGADRPLDRGADRPKARQSINRTCANCISPIPGVSSRHGTRRITTLASNKHCFFGLRSNLAIGSVGIRRSGT